MSADGHAYLDSSAIVKLVVDEDETAALRTYLAGYPLRTASALVRTEVVRSVAPHGRAAVSRARALLGTLNLVRVDDALLDAAAEVQPAAVRSLDAIHLACALTLRPDPPVVVTYDLRMAEAARSYGLAVEAPMP